jgi:hypothetical protein
MDAHRVLYFQAYLEVMTILEEQRSGRRDIHGHKLFHRAARSHFVPRKCVCPHNCCCCLWRPFRLQRTCDVAFSPIDSYALYKV